MDRISKFAEPKSFIGFHMLGTFLASSIIPIKIFFLICFDNIRQLKKNPNYKGI